MRSHISNIRFLKVLKVKFHANWHRERHTLLQAINEFVPFSTFLFDFGKIWNSKIIE